jgi:UDP-N-acetylmuramoyl-tripeptide--D-alanyl-D-alanine ligase
MTTSLLVSLTKSMDSHSFLAITSGYTKIVHVIGFDRGNFTIDSLSLDSRAVCKGCAFLAHKGARVDSHEYALQAIQLGASALIVSNYWYAEHEALVESWAVPVLVCVDALDFLRFWAAMMLDSMPSLIKIGVTGSSGKTSTKDMLVCALSEKYTVWGSPGNFNSVLGLPLAILSMPLSVNCAVFEMAMSEKGEMADLAAMVRPQFAILTSLGTAHLANIGSQEGIAFEKKQIMQHAQVGDLFFVPEDVCYKDILQKDLLASVLEFGPKTLARQGIDFSWRPDNSVQLMIVDDHEIRLSQAGGHVRSNALAVWFLCRSLGMQGTEISRGLGSWLPASGRGNWIECAQHKILLDCYNANPDSMKASYLAFLESLSGTGVRRVAILGDMLELGELEAHAHDGIIRLVIEHKADLVLLCGPRMCASAMRLDKATLETQGIYVSKDLTEAQILCQRLIAPGDLILVKASRGMGLESLLSCIDPALEVRF